MSPRQSTPRTPAASPVPIIIIASPRRVEPVAQLEPMIEPVIEPIAIPMEQETERPSSPSVISKNIAIASLELFDFPMIPIECKFHFQTFNLQANAENIIAHREFLEKKTAQQEKEVQQLLKQFNKEVHSIVVGYVKNSIEPLIDSLKQSNQKRIDNLVLDQMRGKAIRTIKAKCDKDSLEQVGKAQDRFERTLQLKLQLDKLDKRFNENMPPPSLNTMDKLEFRSKELDQTVKEQYTEQWNSIIRKAKLELTSVMRLAKTAEIDKSEKEHQALAEKLPAEVRPAYKDLIHTVKIRLDRTAEKKINFLDRRAVRTNGK